MAIKFDNNKTMTGEFQIGDPVAVNFGNAGRVRNCNILKAHFANGGFESYDLTVLMFQDDNGTPNYARLYNVPRLLIDHAPHEYATIS
jgi:hypothetical protein